MEIKFSDYTHGHKAELEELLESEEWQEVINSSLIDEVKQGRLKPNPVRNYVDNVIEQLVEFNEEKVKGLIRQGNRDESELLNILSQWPENLDGKNTKLSFFGINLSTECNFYPNKCIYCNQAKVDAIKDMDVWKMVLKEITADAGKEGPYIYFTGGEPLLLGEDLYGDNGLIRYATEHGAGVNVNTNATMLTPEVALKLIKSGLAKIHISLDSPYKETQNNLYNSEAAKEDRYEMIIKGIYNVQIARDLVGADSPLIHTNFVLTNQNFRQFPDLLEFIIDKRKLVKKGNPLLQDLMTHVIPMGGHGDNDKLRLTEEEFREFYTEIWGKAKQIWMNHQQKVPEANRIVLFGYFSSPFDRVEHKGGLDAYVVTSAEGVYSKLALLERCYVAPTQAAIAPDGTQYLCGSHAIHQHCSIGNISEKSVFDNIRAGLSELSKLPQEEYCGNCALATLYVNQGIKSKLRERVKELVKENK